MVTQRQILRQESHPYYCDICGADFRTHEEGVEHFNKYHSVYYKKKKLGKVI
jgi:uncharacterized C2H2 Zn-finger protein